MANPVQWTVEQFYSQLQAVKNKINAADAALNADRLALMAMYSAARRANDSRRDEYLGPLIHHNTVLRLSYLKPLRDKYMQAVNAATGALRQAGITAPQLSGIGVLPAAVLVPAAAVAALLAVMSAAVIVSRMTEAQRGRTSAMRAIFTNPNTSTDEKLRLAAALQASIDADRRATPPPFDLSALTLPLGLLAAIILGPTLLRSLPSLMSRRRAA